MEVLNANIMITLPTFYPFALVISDYFSMFLLFSACFLAISTSLFSPSEFKKNCIIYILDWLCIGSHHSCMEKKIHLHSHQKTK